MTSLDDPPTIESEREGVNNLIFGFSLAESRKAIVAAIYFGFAIVMLVGVVPHVGFENAVLALVGPGYAVAGVFLAKHHSVDDLQKALEALKAAALTAVSFYVATPASIGNVMTMLITGIVMAAGVYWTRNAGQGAPAAPRGP